jgi:hypothetical protein
VAHQPHFRTCLHRDAVGGGVIGGDAASALAAIRGEFCATEPAMAAGKATAGATPILPGEIFPHVVRLLGPDAFRQLWSDFSRAGPDWLAGGKGFADFLRQHRYGQELPALVDLALLELTSHQVQRAPDLPSIGACCLPRELLKQHPDLRLHLQPGWHYVTLGHAVQELAADRLDRSALRRLRIAGSVQLRLMPGMRQADWLALTAAAYAFETMLTRHETLRAATETARRIDPRFDGIATLQRLIEAGGVVDILLHPHAPGDLPQMASPGTETERRS